MKIENITNSFNSTVTSDDGLNFCDHDQVRRFRNFFKDTKSDKSYTRNESSDCDYEEEISQQISENLENLNIHLKHNIDKNINRKDYIEVNLNSKDGNININDSEIDIDYSYS